MRNYKGYSVTNGTIVGNIYDVEVTVDVTEKDLLKMMKKYLPENLYEHVTNELIDNPPKEDFTYELDTETDVRSAEMSINGSDIEDCLNQMNEDEAKEICFRFLNDSSAYYKTGTHERIVLVPNLSAEQDFQEFLESYNKKWSL